MISGFLWDLFKTDNFFVFFLFQIDVAEQKGSFLYAAFGKLKYVFLLIFVPPFLNYASLQREQNELRPIGGYLRIKPTFL